MIARRFFYVCVGLCLLAVAYHLGASNAGAQSSTGQETAVLAGAITDGGTIPLPTYADGTQALESECQWTVSVQTLGGAQDFERCSTTGRVVHVYNCNDNCGQPQGVDCSPIRGPGCVGPRAGTANYLIIATRATGTVATTRKTLGQLKGKYRSPAGR